MGDDQLSVKELKNIIRFT